jgi:DNA ligase-associated metallophosphoesterase
MPHSPFGATCGMQITLAGTLGLLDPSGAVYLPDSKSILLADVHLGKAMHFRKAGAPLPGEIEEDNLIRLRQLIGTYNPVRIYLLGDLFHSSVNAATAAFHRFMEDHPAVAFVLVPGNHDARQLAQHHGRLELAPPQLELGALTLVHEPDLQARSGFQVGGHLHPAIALKGKAGLRATLPCFWKGPHFLVLPSFGTFTGHKPVKPLKNHQIIAVGPAGLMEIA